MCEMSYGGNEKKGRCKVGKQESVKDIIKNGNLKSFQRVLLVTDRWFDSEIMKKEKIFCIKGYDLYEELGLSVFEDVTSRGVRSILKNEPHVREWVEVSYPIVITDKDDIKDIFRENTEVEVFEI